MPLPVKQTEKPKGKASVTILISILLALVLGAGGYFGVTFLLSGQSPLDIISGDFTPKSHLPTDSEGNNLMGNSTQNLYAGGLIAVQGKDIFYANPADGGSLYCRDRKGNITKLTDFAVANLNVSGESLIFTDLDACYYTDENGKLVTLSADTHEEIWNEAGENNNIRYGGRLYFITGIKSFCAGNLSYEELSIVGVDSEESYQAPILMENGELLLIVSSPNSDIEAVSSNSNFASAITPLSAGKSVPIARTVKADRVAFTPSSIIVVGEKGITKRLEVDVAKQGCINNATIADGKIFVETTNIMDPSRTDIITRVDAKTGKALGTIEGHSMQTDGDRYIYFINKGIIFRYCAYVEAITQVSHTPCYGEYEIMPDGTVNYYSLDPIGNTFVPMRSVPDKEGEYIPSRDSSKMRHKMEKLKAFLFEKDYFVWNIEHSGWSRVRRPWRDEKESVGVEGLEEMKTPLPWSIERRDKGPNAIKWLPPGELGELFIKEKESADSSDDSSADRSSDSSADRSNKIYYNEDDMARSLAAITRMTQGYGLYEHGQIEHAYNPVEYDTVKNYYVDIFGDDYSLDEYISSITAEIVNVIGVDDSYVPELREAVKSWVKRFEFAVGKCTIDDTEFGAGEEGRALIVILERVHITTDSLSTALLTYIANDYPGGLKAFAKDEHYMQWMQEAMLNYFKNPFAFGDIGKTDVMVAIPMCLDEELGWMPENLESIRSNFIVIDKNLEFNIDAPYEVSSKVSKPSEPSGPLSAVEGEWRRVGHPVEQIFFEGDQIIWTLGGRDDKILVKGSFEIKEGKLYVDSGAQGSTSFEFSQRGDEITIENWTYER